MEIIIEHIAIWVEDLERMKEFYTKYFDLKSNNKYFNQKKNFSSYFLSSSNGARLELMHKPKLTKKTEDEVTYGFAHLAFSVGSKEKVDELTELLRKDEYEIVGEPRTTGDGYYESVIKDPERNLIEITE